MTSEAREWQPEWECRLGAQLGGLRRGAGDPTYRITEDGTHWRGIRTPEGAVALALWQSARSVVQSRATGPGAAWVLERVPQLLGDGDDPTGFVPEHPVLAEAVRRFGVPRFGRTDLVFEAVVPAILEQKVTGQEAFAGYRSLVRGFGEPAPDIGEELDLWVPPTPQRVAAIASWEWLGMHVDRARSQALVGAARVAGSLERIVGVDPTEGERRLRSLPGIGEWTAAEVLRRALGAADAVSFGDYHVAKDVGWALTGAEVDDDGLRTLLEPWRGHRARVVALVGAAGLHRPRRGPRMAPRTHLPAPTPGTRRLRAGGAGEPGRAR